MGYDYFIYIKVKDIWGPLMIERCHLGHNLGLDLDAIFVYFDEALGRIFNLNESEEIEKYWDLVRHLREESVNKYNFMDAAKNFNIDLDLKSFLLKMYYFISDNHVVVDEYGKEHSFEEYLERRLI